MPRINLSCKEENGDLMIRPTLLCNTFGIAPSTFSDWKKKGCPAENQGWYNFREVLKWRMETVSAGGAAAMSNEARKLKADAEYRETKAAREQVLLDRMKGEYLDKNDVVRAWATRVAEVRAGLTQWVRELTGSFSDPDVQREVEVKTREKVKQLCDGYARDGTYTPRHAKQKKPGRVGPKGA